ncbi:MAG: RNA polymerase sigma factor [Bacteroidales bacterium]|nr:RNA polymerase sigma factor [Bacteroidales bacterium]
MQQKKDIEIIASVLKGNTNDFGLLIDRYQDKAFRLSISILKNEDEAQEITHMAFIKAYENLGRFKNEAKFSTWFFRIVYNLCISHHRYEQKFSRDISPEETADLAPAELNEGIKYLNRKEQQKYIARAFECLASDDLVLVKGYYMEDLDMNELAAITGLSISNVKVKLFRARKRLYLELEKCLKDELMSLIEEA